MLIITAHQPNYIPWLGFFHRMNYVDKFVILDNVQFTKDAFIQRNKIKTSNGELMLTVPVKVKTDTLIKDVLIDNSQSWQKRHWLSIKYNYNKSPYWDYLSNELEDIYNKNWIKLFDLNMKIIELIRNKLNINTEIIIASELKQDFGKKTNLLIALCKHLEADTFFSGAGSKTYIEQEKFNQNNINLFFQNYNHPIYKQRMGNFISHLSILDLLFNCGPKSLEILIQGNLHNNNHSPF
ncbi:WbqC family protein [Clostridium sp. Cult2]|uniref:WbqC family protein n=1 Tax=Clostridium sp. Cult2 TaxID=2079003 RepID=UPI001F3B8C64|nr:WbqC family protein [Clostridium sp. Cult2]MCF6465674.1 hypothetical protein [Clostridium sp. Cult2]